MIEDAGFTVIEASNADEAISILETRFDITTILTDIEMPGSMDGLKLAFAVRDRWPPIRIIIASGRIRPQPHEMPGEVQFLSKPCSQTHVAQALRGAGS
ncbi:MAG: response regulator [Stutzerimonas stutzeri]|nr:MAG: response regulator [Stutzerimonas stutzeri]